MEEQEQQLRLVLPLQSAELHTSVCFQILRPNTATTSLVLLLSTDWTIHVRYDTVSYFNFQTLETNLNFVFHTTNSLVDISILSFLFIIVFRDAMAQSGAATSGLVRSGINAVESLN